MSDEQQGETIGRLTLKYGLIQYQLKNGFPNPTVLLGDDGEFTPPYSDDLPTIYDYLKFIVADWFGRDDLDVAIVVSLPSPEPSAVSDGACTSTDPQRNHSPDEASTTDSVDRQYPI